MSTRRNKRPVTKSRVRTNDNRKDPMTTDVGGCIASFPRRKPTHADVEQAAKRTEVEQAATDAANIASNVSDTRRWITNLENQLSDARAALSSLMLNHQAAVTKIKDLTAIAQPVV